MVSLYNTLGSEKMFMGSEDACKKRKWDWSSRDSDRHQGQSGISGQKLKAINNSDVGIELHEESPLPPEWQQCLDLQSGQIYYYNPSTQMKTWKDPRGTAMFASERMGLDLELNLPSASKDAHKYDQQEAIRSKSSALCNENSSEMIAVACMHCHMFVMLCKASPSCPNCKYMHPIDQNSTAKKKNTATVRKTLSLLDYNHEDHVQTPK